MFLALSLLWGFGLVESTDFNSDFSPKSCLIHCVMFLLFFSKFKVKSLTFCICLFYLSFLILIPQPPWEDFHTGLRWNFRFLCGCSHPLHPAAIHTPPESLKIPPGVRWKWGMSKGVRPGNSRTQQGRISADTYWGFKEQVAFGLAVEDFWGLWWVGAGRGGTGTPSWGKGDELRNLRVPQTNHPWSFPWNRLLLVFLGTDKAQKKVNQKKFFSWNSLLTQGCRWVTRSISYITPNSLLKFQLLFTHSRRHVRMQASLIFPWTWPQMGLIYLAGPIIWGQSFNSS